MGSEMCIRDRLMQVVNDRKLAEQAKRGALEMVKKAREVVGEHPIFAEIEMNANAEHFKYTFDKAIEESNISAVPVEFVISNLEQLKSDLGMGDGIVSRAIDQAVHWNWNDTNAKRYRDDSKTEVHYHVEDMQEAIRRENLRARKQMMKMN